MAQFTPHPRRGYLVGGAVRDLLRGQPPQDLDWLTPEPEAEARRAAETLRGSAFALDAARGHWRVVAAGRSIDFARLAEPLEHDLARRDFTINAMALGIDGDLIDPFGGARDLRAKRLRLVAPDALERDPLRAWRALRFRATLGFKLEPEARAALLACLRAQRSGALPMPAWERTQLELDKLLMSEAAPRVLGEAHELGLLALYLPELAACAGVEQGGFHHLDVLEHQLEALGQLLQRFPDADSALRWATLLHDLGKPATKRYDEARRSHHFYGHAKLGAELGARLLTRLRYPERLVRRVAALIRYHMLPLPQNEREARRFVHRRRELLPDLLKLMIADREAARGPRASAANREAYRLALARVLGILAEPPPKAPLLRGHEVMALLGLPPGPRVGEALRLVSEAEAVGDIGSRAEAEALLRRYAERQGWLVEGA